MRLEVLLASVGYFEYLPKYGTFIWVKIHSNSIWVLLFLKVIVEINEHHYLK